MSPITTQEVGVLLNMLKHRDPVVAPWNHRQLSQLRSRGFVDDVAARQAAGRLSSNKIWTITEQGRRFLEEERAGQ